MHEAIVNTFAGTLRGAMENGAAVFRGVRFAQPPIGDLRFKNPVPVAPWKGVQDALAFAPICPQGPGVPMGTPEPQGEDCLALNVWTPATDGARRPVLFWIHGGGFVGGSSSIPLYHGDTFAAKDVVLVSTNYRVHAMGFLDLEGYGDGFENSSNSGVMDVVTALEWVRTNIAEFGGDPDNVTIFGESAGAALVGALMATPRAHGLFHKAIGQSGTGHHTRSREVARRATDFFFNDVGVAHGDVAALQALPIEKILSRVANYGTGQNNALQAVFGDDDSLNAMPFRMTHGDDVIPVHPVTALADGTAANVPHIIGANDDEFRMIYLAGDGIKPADAGLMPLAMQAERLGTSIDDLLALYRKAEPERSEDDVTIAMCSDLWFIMPGRETADLHARHQPKTYRYSFSWHSPANGGLMRASHTLDIPFVFDHLEKAYGMRWMLGDNPPGSLAVAMQDAWIRFARTGDPGWPAWGPESRQVMRWGTEPAVVDDPEADRASVWRAVFPALS